MTSPGSFLYILFLKFFPLDNIVSSEESSPVSSEVERALNIYVSVGDAAYAVGNGKYRRKGKETLVGSDLPIRCLVFFSKT